MAEDNLIKIDLDDDETPEEDDELVVIDYTRPDELGDLDGTLHPFELTAHMNGITISDGFENILFQFVIHPTVNELDKVADAIVTMIKDKFVDERAEFLNSISAFIKEQLIDMEICASEQEAQDKTDILSFKLAIEVNKGLAIIDEQAAVKAQANQVQG